jgi:glyceraldehyde-3-phosphate dehydrogenase/erythrose-4-phosphate dehydrogenase
MVLEELVGIYFDCFKPPTIEVVAINDLADKKTMAHLLKNSIHGVLPQSGSDEKNSCSIFMKKKFQIYLGKA